MHKRFEGRTVVITGGGGGIGKAAARRFLDEGARVVLAGVVEEARHELDPTGERTLAVAGQIATREDGQRLVAAAVERFGGLDVLVNSTGVFRPVPFAEQTEEHFEGGARLDPAPDVLGGAGRGPRDAYSAAQAGRHMLTRERGRRLDHRDAAAGRRRRARRPFARAATAAGRSRRRVASRRCGPPSPPP